MEAPEMWDPNTARELHRRGNTSECNMLKTNKFIQVGTDILKINQYGAWINAYRRRLIACIITIKVEFPFLTLTILSAYFITMDTAMPLQTKKKQKYTYYHKNQEFIKGHSEDMWPIRDYYQLLPYKIQTDQHNFIKFDTILKIRN